MKRGLRDILFAFLGFVIAFAVQEYAIQRHEHIKTIEKEVLKQKIKREDEILIKRLDEDYQAYKDSIDQVFIQKRNQFIAERGEPPEGNKLGMEMRDNAEKNRILAKKRREIDRQIEDLKMRLDF
jgi:hypothetical protein